MRLWPFRRRVPLPPLPADDLLITEERLRHAADGVLAVHERQIRGPVIVFRGALQMDPARAVDTLLARFSAFGYTPFSLIHCCGWFLGNPLGLHYQGDWPVHVAIDDPAFPGVNGHVRVLGVLQAKELAEHVGFQADVTSIGLMPVPEFIGRRLERFWYRRGHFLLMRLKKPSSPQTEIGKPA